MMKAAQYTAFSTNNSDVKVVEVQKPKASPGLAVVRVVAASGNPIDYKVFRGYLDGAWTTPLPFTMGYDFAGVVDEISQEDRAGFAVGDEVFAVNWGVNKHDEADMPIGGAFAEYITIPVSKLSRKPSGVSFAQAAALALVGTTAHQVVVDCAKVTAGSRVLILGASSSVGQLAVQLAKSRGAWVAATCSSRTMEFARQFGADKLIDYRQAKWEDDVELKDIDAVIDTVGEADAFPRSTSTGVVKQGGVYVSIATPHAGFVPDAHAPRLSFAAMYCVSNKPAVQEELVNMVANGSLKLVIEKSFPFTNEGVLELLNRMEGGTSISMGKNVLEISAV
jgi:NADPH:quinone reductase-like Zn-dependent oxidoreductase